MNVFVSSCVLFLMISCQALSAFALTEGFEDGSLAENWSMTGDLSYEFSTDYPKSGNNSFKFVKSYGSGSSVRALNTLQTRTNTKEDGTISFSTTAEDHIYDLVIKFYIDNNLTATIHPAYHTEGEWNTWTYSLAAGEHVLRWETWSESSDLSGPTIYLDDIQTSSDEKSLVATDLTYDDTCSASSDTIWLGDYLGNISGITKSEVTVSINGTQITDFEFEEVSPAALSTGIALGTTGVASYDERRMRETTLTEWITSMQSDEKASVTKFDSQTLTLESLTDDKSLLYDAVNYDSYDAWNTQLYGGAMEAINQVCDGQGDDKILLLYANGYSNSDEYTEDEVVAAAKANDVTIYTFYNQDQQTRYNEENLQSLAEQTGGTYYSEESSIAFPQAFAEIRAKHAYNYRINLDKELYPALGEAGTTIQVTIETPNGTVSSTSTTESCGSDSNILYLVLPIISKNAQR